MVTLYGSDVELQERGRWKPMEIWQGAKPSTSQTAKLNKVSYNDNSPDVVAEARDYNYGTAFPTSGKISLEYINRQKKLLAKGQHQHQQPQRQQYSLRSPFKTVFLDKDTGSINHSFPTSTSSSSSAAATTTSVDCYPMRPLQLKLSLPIIISLILFSFFFEFSWSLNLFSLKVLFSLYLLFVSYFVYVGVVLGLKGVCALVFRVVVGTIGK
ncbi:hypothetical protein DFH27DRAFT_222603 [Peziza echinospora]|nr:hypothetical protein DFH27DRAFT_222603 [Peziza echinospora]